MKNLEHARFLVGRPKWCITKTVCALTDDERHLGHIYKIGAKWHAYDATRMNPEGNSFRLVGVFPSFVLAKEGIEQSLAERPRVMVAGAA